MKGMALAKKLPTSLKVLGKTYQVKVVKPSSANTLLRERDAAAGTSSSQDCLITINANQCTEQMKDTLIHECIHMCDQTVCLDLSERQVHALAGCFQALLSDNPQLASFICSK